MTTPIDVLHVVTDTDRRGAQRFGADLDAWLTERGHASRLVALAPGTSTDGLPIEPLGQRRLGGATLRALRTALRGPRVVVAHGSSTLLACGVAGAGVGTPLIYRSIGDMNYWANTPRRRAQVRALLRRTDAVVTLWTAARDTLVSQYGVAPARVAVIPRGVNSQEFPLVDEASRRSARSRFGVGRGDAVLVSLGSLSPEKGLETAIATVAAIGSARLLVAGDGPMRRSLTTTSDSVAPGRVTFLGTVSRPAEVLAAADVLVLPSRTEGLPGVAVEAGLSGVPTVATDVGGVRDVVLDGVTGRVVAPGDAEPFIDAVRSTLDEARHLGAAAREHCLRVFDLAVVGAAWEQVLWAVQRVPAR